MGVSCSYCGCTDGKEEVATVLIHKNDNKSNPKIRIKDVIRIQAWYRGNRCRK